MPKQIARLPFFFRVTEEKETSWVNLRMVEQIRHLGPKDSPNCTGYAIMFPEHAYERKVTKPGEVAALRQLLGDVPEDQG